LQQKADQDESLDGDSSIDDNVPARQFDYDSDQDSGRNSGPVPETVLDDKLQQRNQVFFEECDKQIAKTIK